MNYLLSTGEVTSKIERYILDLFDLYLKVYPDDIPGSGIGFDFILTDIKKSELVSEVKYRVEKLVNQFQERFKGVSIGVDSIEIIDEETANIRVRINQLSSNIEVLLYGEGS